MQYNKESLYSPAQNQYVSISRLVLKYAVENITFFFCCCEILVAKYNTVIQSASNCLFTCCTTDVPPSHLVPNNHHFFSEKIYDSLFPNFARK